MGVSVVHALLHVWEASPKGFCRVAGCLAQLLQVPTLLLVLLLALLPRLSFLT